MIEVRDLVKKYGSHRAVDGVSFDVARGELFGLLGPNGAGKTTTISVLATLLAADGGKARIGGHDVAAEPAAVRRLIGVVPQEIALYGDLGARENLAFWGRIHGLSGHALAARVDELLAMTGLAEHGRQKVDTYSGGQKRRLNLAAGLVHSPEVLFLDEPTVGIDAQARTRILEMIQELAAGGLTVIYTTHYLEEAEQLCDRIGVIDRGRMVALGDKEELIRQIGDEDAIRCAVPGEHAAAFAEAALAWPGVVRVGERRGLAELRTRDAAAALPRVQDWLQGRGLPLAQLEVERPNLETLYLSLTGRGLRE
ncbi:MAG TPA: ABC transporter ATP-binding protein, partial [Candidatus Krumholzibacteria bacterium]|nr:ABC transporter ATP-binding protein [Candidatus Krumholzibacteria bacterium]